MKANVRWYEISGGILMLALDVCMLLFSAISLAEREMQAAMFSFGVFLLLCIATITITRLKRNGRLEGARAQRAIKVFQGVFVFFTAILFIPTEYYTPKKSCGTTELAGEQARYDSRKQPGAKLFVKTNKSMNSDQLTLTVYDICVGKISHKIFRDGPVNPQRMEILNRRVLTEKIKDDARSLGAHVVGITELKPQYVFSHDVEGNPVTVKHKYAIVIGIGMNYRLASPSAPLPWEDYYSALPEDIAAELSGLMVRSSTKVSRKVVDEVREAMEFFSEGGLTAVQLAKSIRRLGYPARAHLHNRAGEVQIIPLAMLEIMQTQHPAFTQGREQGFIPAHSAHTANEGVTKIHIDCIGRLVGLHSVRRIYIVDPYDIFIRESRLLVAPAGLTASHLEKFFKHLTPPL